MTDDRKIRVWQVGAETFVSDENGVEYKLHGYGSMKHDMLDLDPRIDLAEPIYEQVQRLAAEERAEGEDKHPSAV